MKAKALIAGAIALVIVIIFAVDDRRSSLDIGKQEHRQLAGAPSQSFGRPDAVASDAGAMAGELGRHGAQERLAERTPGLKPSPPNEAKARETLLDVAQTETVNAYGQLVKDLKLSQEVEDSLLDVLTKIKAGEMSNRFQQGTPADPEDKARQVAKAIGGDKAREFFEREKQMPAYWELGQLSTLLSQNGAPLTEIQRAGLFDLLGSLMTEYTAGANGEEARGVEPLKQLEKQLKRKDEYERHLLEQAPSVLTQKQVGLMFDQFEYRSEQRANAINIQERRRAEHPDEKVPIWSPAI
jgi:hypothetical protein